MRHSSLSQEHLGKALVCLENWVLDQQWLGWDPFDALNSRIYGKWVGRSRLVDIVLTQIIKRSPVNLRSILGVEKGVNAKGMALFLNAVVRRYRCTHSPRHLELIQELSAWLHENHSEGVTGKGWGYYFPWANRAFTIPGGTPNAVATAFVAQAMLDLVNLCETNPEVSEVLDFDPLQDVFDACEFFIRGLNKLESGPDEICFSYTGYDQRYLHNINVLCAQILGQTYQIMNRPEYMEHASRALNYTVRRQHENGAWRYGESAREGFIDSFHTGYILVGMKKWLVFYEDPALVESLERGYHFWKKMFLLPDGRVRTYSSGKGPVDLHSVAQAVLTLLEFKDQDPEAEDLALRSLEWAIDHMHDIRGYFYYQQAGVFTNRIPYLRWVQAWMYLSMSAAINEFFLCR